MKGNHIQNNMDPHLSNNLKKIFSLKEKEDED